VQFVELKNAYSSAIKQMAPHLQIPPLSQPSALFAPEALNPEAATLNAFGKQKVLSCYLIFRAKN
ncbi:MAG: hypothetical protein K1Y36_05740, partial [Blastocatellia bacterium]|nr:hypothetical protein [Blastocatellia bacterium]